LENVATNPVAEVRESRSSSERTRLTSLDALRGMAIAGMIFVNAAGADVWSELRHAGWDGLTLADLVFPMFLVAMGASMALGKAPSARRVVRRAAILFAIGLVLNALTTPGPLRYCGVLQRIAVDYALAAAIIRLPKRAIVATSVAVLVGYTWILLAFGHGPMDSAAASVDQWLFGRAHLNAGGLYDPEGLISTLASVVTVLIGFLVGDWVRRAPRIAMTPIRLLASAGVLAAIGAVISALVPINKKLWSPSFILVTAAFSIAVFACTFWLCDVGRNRGRWFALPFSIMGANALVLYIISELAEIVLHRTYTSEITCSGAGCGAVSLHAWVYSHGYASWAGARVGSLVYSLVFLGVLWLVALVLWRRRIFIRV
jgi:predicted acyltransferase